MTRRSNEVKEGMYTIVSKTRIALDAGFFS